MDSDSILDSDSGYFMGSVERGSESGEETQHEQDQMEHENKKANTDAAAEETKQEQAVRGSLPKPN